MLACSDDPVAIGDRGIEIADAVQQIPIVDHIASRARGEAGRTRCGHAARADWILSRTLSNQIVD